jgi:hypothetical protein
LVVSPHIFINWLFSHSYQLCTPLAQPAIRSETAREKTGPKSPRPKKVHGTDRRKSGKLRQFLHTTQQPTH